MKHLSLSSGLSRLRRILKAAIDHCNPIPGLPVEIQSAVRDHSLSCLTIKEVIELVGKSQNVARSGAQHCRLLEQHLHAAEAARRNIQNTTATYRHTHIGLKAEEAATRHHEFTACVLSNLSRIVTALNSAILLVTIRLNNSHTRVLIAKLRSLITSCQKADKFSHKPTEKSVSLTFKPQAKPHRSNDTEVEEILQPSNVAYVLSELHAVYAHAGASAFGATIVPPNVQLLNINLLSLLLERQPVHPPQVFPTLVSYHSDVILATRAGDLQWLTQLLNESPDLLYCFTVDNLTLMTFAIESGDIKTVQYLLHMGLNVNDTYGRSDTSPLATALQFRHLHITKLLIHAGADFNHKNKYGWSPLFYIWFKEDRSTSAGPLLGLLAANASFNVMHENIYDKDGWSVMHRAAVYGTSQDVSTLVQLGVDPFAVTRTKSKNPADDCIHNYSVLQHVVLDGLADTVKVLLPFYRERFGNIDLPDERGWTLLHMAIEEQHLPVVGMLVENDADLWAKTKTTWIPRISDTHHRRHTPFSLAKSFGPQFFQYSIHVVLCHQQVPRCTKVQAVAQRLYNAQISISPMSDQSPALTSERIGVSDRGAPSLSKERESRVDYRNRFGRTTVSGDASAHLGDSVYHIHITNYNFGGTSSKAELERLKLHAEPSQRAQHSTRKEVLRPLPRSVQRDSGEGLKEYEASIGVNSSMLLWL